MSVGEDDWRWRATAGRKVEAARLNGKVLAVGIVEIIEYVHLLSAQRAGTRRIEGHGEVPGVAALCRAPVRRGDPCATESSVRDIAAVHARLDRTDQVRSARIGVADLVVQCRRLPHVHVAEVHDCVAAGGARCDVASERLRGARVRPRGENLSGSAHVRAIAEAVAGPEVCVLVIRRNGDAVRA